nr:outer membrane usher protein [uncultured Enterobacter sp.]
MKYQYLHVCCLAGIASSALSLPAAAEMAVASDSVEFDNSFLVGAGAEKIDVSRYSNGNPTLPGSYKVNVYINDQPFTALHIDFVNVGKTSAVPCFTPKLLAQLGIKSPGNREQRDAAAWPGVSASHADDDGRTDNRCYEFEKWVPSGSMRFDNGEMRMDLSVPQIALEKKYRGYVSPTLWENGINAAMLSYTLNGYSSTYNEQTDESAYLGLTAGVNLGAWHFRARGNMGWDKENGTTAMDYQNRYVQRDLPGLRSQIQLGETNTTGDAFDSVAIRGGRFYSDDRMLPAMLTGYAPVIRGVANTNAKITIEQGGYKIYETTVAPGPFAIDDLSPSGYGNELNVTVEEADGSKRSFSVPFSSLVQLLRPGMSRWDLSAGEVNQDDLHEKPNLIQGTYYHGLSNLFTGYGGIQLTDNDYYAGLLGVGLNTPVGAFAVDVTYSNTKVPDDKTYRGQSYRLSYNRLFSETDTSLNIAAYRYSTRDYMGLNDAIQLIDNINSHHLDGNGEKYSFATSQRVKNQVTLSISQPLAFGAIEVDYGSLYANLSWEDYWGEDEERKNYSVGYSGSAFWGSYGITLQRTYDEDDNADDSIFVNVSIPLETLFGGQHRASGFRSIESTFNSDFDGGHQLNMSSSGNDESGKLNYSVNTGYQLTKEGNNDAGTVGGYMSYDSPYGTWSTSASADSNEARQFSVSTDGGFVLHAGGLTFSNDSFNDTDTLVLVKAPGAKGANINYGASTVDRWGYGVAGAMSPYRENRVSLDVSSLENDVELKSTSGVTVPRQGAITLVNFETNEGRSALISLLRSDKQSLPLGAEVYDDRGQLLGNVGQFGQAFIRGIETRGTLNVVWGSESDQRCTAKYTLPDNPQKLGHTTLLPDTGCVIDRQYTKRVMNDQ